MVVIPLTMAILGLIGTGALATIEHEKNLAYERDQQRLADISSVQGKLDDYYLKNSAHPLQKDEATDGWKVLQSYLDNLPNDPLNSKGWSYAYWSDSKSYTLRYMQEETMEERVVFGY